MRTRNHLAGWTRRTFLDRSLRTSLALGAGLTAAPLLEACAARPPGAVATPAPGAHAIRTLMLDQVGYDVKILQRLAARFQDLQHGKAFVSIETAHYRELYDSIRAAGLSHPSPYDVAAVDQVWIPELATRTQLLSLSERLPDDVRADLMPSLLDAFSYQGRAWAMPHVLNVQSLYYNVAHLRAAGFQEAPKTLEDWYAQMTALRRRQVPYTDSWAEGEGLVTDFIRLVAQFGGDLFDGSGHPQLAAEPVQRAAAFMRRLIDERLVLPEATASTEPDAMRAFLAGRVSYTTNWNFVFGAMSDPGFSHILGQGAVGVVPAAADAARPAASVSGFMGLAVLSGSPEPDLAMAWVRYLTSPEVQAQQLGQLPIWTSLQHSPDFGRANPQLGVFLTNLENAHTRPKLPHYVEASAVLQRHLHDLVSGAASPSGAMAEAQAELISLEARRQTP